TLTAKLGTRTATATVRVLDVAEAPALVSITPASSAILVGASQTLAVTLDIPAPAGGAAGSLALTPAHAGAIPTSVTVPAEAANATSASFSYADGSTVSSATVTATLDAVTKNATIETHAQLGGLVINEIDYDNILNDTAEFIELYNGSAAPIVLTGYSIVLIN